MITIEDTGPLALIEDLGRPQLAGLGVSPSGAADRGGHLLANRLVGNRPEAATIEVTLGGLVLTSHDLHWIAVAGAGTQLWHNGTPAASHSTLLLRPGDQLRLDPPARGLRNYVAVRGGIEVPPVLGSRSFDVLSKIGPAPLQPGRRLQIGTPLGALPDTDFAPVREPAAALAITPGPRLDWFTEHALAELTGHTWLVGTDCNRTAVRLQGPPLERRISRELPSEGLIRGAIQVPSSGQPLIFLADHPVTGGYPVLAVLTEAATDLAAQLRPGDTVKLLALDSAEA